MVTEDIPPDDDTNSRLRALLPVQLATPEPDYSKLDEGIRDTVRWLRGHRFATSDSGDGSKAREMDCALPFPNVAILVPDDQVSTANPLVHEAERLRFLLEVFGLELQPCAMAIEGAITIQASYDPVDRIGVILLSNLDDKRLAAALDGAAAKVEAEPFHMRKEPTCS